LPFRTQPVDAPPQVDAPQQDALQHPPSATVTQNPDILFLQRPGVNMRSAASSTSRVVANPQMGTRFEVTNRESSWVQVESGALKGWINGRFLAVTEPQPPETLRLQTSAAGSAPTVDIKRTCQVAQKTITAIFGDDTAITVDGCLRQEQEAADHLAKNWATYPSEDRQRCVNRTSYMPSYVEWLTCFEMARDVRQIRKDQPDAPTKNKAQRKSKTS